VVRNQVRGKGLPREKRSRLFHDYLMKMRSAYCVLLAFSVGSAVGDQRCDVSQFPLSAPTDRFQDNGDGTVTDTASGLMWMRCSVGQTWQHGDCVGDLTSVDWRSAQAVAETINGDGSFFFSDWRIPKLPDLATIIERQCQDPRINLTVFPETPAAAFWTSTGRPGDESEDSVYALSFGPEGVQRMQKDQLNYVRLVRTAQ
jgi:hypothetical protein